MNIPQPKTAGCSFSFHVSRIGIPSLADPAGTSETEEVQQAPPTKMAAGGGKNHKHWEVLSQVSYDESGYF